MPWVAPKPLLRSPDIQTWFSAVSYKNHKWFQAIRVKFPTQKLLSGISSNTSGASLTCSRFITLSRVAVLSGPTSYDLITTVCLYPTPPSMISPCRWGSTSCFFVGILRRTSSSITHPFAATEASRVLEALADWVRKSASETDPILTPLSFMYLCLWEESLPSLAVEHLTTK